MESKDAYYFPHDSNAKDDPDCLVLIEELGLEGYGIFWVLVETLRDQKNFRAPLRILPPLARRYNTTAEKMKAVVVRYNLFQVDEDSFFYSDSLIRRMQPLIQRKLNRRIDGIKGNLIRYKHATKAELDDMSPDEIFELNKKIKLKLGGDSGGDRQATRIPIASKVKESRVNEIKGECVKQNTPTLDDILNFFTGHGGDKAKARKFYNHYNSLDWETTNGRRIKNWKARAKMWIEEDKGTSQNPSSTGQNVPMPSFEIPHLKTPVQWDIRQLDYYRSELKEKFQISIDQVDELSLMISEKNYDDFISVFDKISRELNTKKLQPDVIYMRIKELLNGEHN
ncbi:MAG: DUF4373 domain-containing protein [Balneolaceae bacterium]|nr:DUF4373 domain-containing protein [Balneolaceae bacterium]